MWRQRGRQWALWLVCGLLLIALVSAAARRGVSLPNFSLRPPLLERDRLHYKTTYACEGRELSISCDEGQHIHLVRANYGRFSISICNDHGNLDWSVNCMSYRSFLIMQDRCIRRSKCGIVVSSSIFGDPCPGTLKYLEVQYHCVQGNGPPGASFTTKATNARDSIQPTALANVTTALPTNHTSSLNISTLSTSTSLTDLQSTTVSSVSSLTTVGTTPFVTTLPPITTLLFSPETGKSFPLVNTTVEDSTVVSPPPPVELTTLDPRESYCSPIYSRNLFWNWTRVGDVIIQKCPGGSTGLARWHCSADPIGWLPDRPDLRECKSLWVESLRDRMHQGDSIISIASELALMTLTKGLYSADLKHVTEMVQQTQIRAVHSLENFLDMWHRHQVLKELLESVAETVSNLLDDEQEKAWDDLSVSERRQVASVLLEGLDESALLLAETAVQETSFLMPKTNVLLSVQVLDTRTLDTVQFPSVTDVQETSWVRIEDSLLLPAQILMDSSKHGFARVVFMAYNKVEDLLKPEPGFQLPTFPVHNVQNELSPRNVTRIINSRVLSASLGRHRVGKLPQPAFITLKHIQEENVTNPQCVFWDFNTREWADEGCRVESHNLTHTTCACNHLTSFAVLMEVRHQEMSTQRRLLRIVTAVGCAVSIICLLLTVFSLQILRSLKGDHFIVLKNLCLCLMMSETVFVAGIDQTQYRILCGVVAGLLHFFLLATFAWMFLEGFQLYAMLVEVFEAEKSRAVWYYALAYGVPTLVTGVAAVVDPYSYGTEENCWLRADNYFIFSFVGPAVGILFGCTVFLSIATCILCHHSSMSTIVKGKEEARLMTIRCWLRLAILLLCLLALTWTSAMLYINNNSVFLAYAFTVLNCLQGIFIFIFYCLRNDKAQDEMEKILQEVKWLPACLRQTKGPEHHPNSNGAVPSLTPTGTHSGPPQSWNSEDKNSSAILKFTTPGHPSTVSQTKREVDANRQDNPLSVTLTRGNLESGKTAQSPYWSAREIAEPSGSCATEASLSSDQINSEMLAAERQLKSLEQRLRQSPGRRLSESSDLCGTYADHIYETIDDDRITPVADYYRHSLALQQGLQGEHYYGEHSDMSQHSSSSYGYDQRPLLLAPVNGRYQTTVTPQAVYGISRDNYSLSSTPELQRHWPERTHGSHRWRTSERLARGSAGGRSSSASSSPKPLHHDPVPNQVVAESGHPQDGEDWSPTLPDLLRYPNDSAVVMAVLDGEKVVSRIRQEPTDPRHQTHYKLSTYC